VLSAYGMGLAEVRAMREVQLDRIGEEAREEVTSQGIAQVTLLRRAHLRYDGSHQALEVPFGSTGEMQAAFEAAHKQRFGFYSPERAILFEMLSVEAVGETGQAPGAALPDGNGVPIAHVPVHLGEETGDVPLYDRDRLDPNLPITGPAIITEATGTNMVEPGWQARVDAMGNLILERIEKATRAHAAGTKVDPVLLEVFNNLFMSVADQMGATLENTSMSVNIKERLDFSCAIFDADGDLVANAPHVPVHLGSMSDSIKTVMRLNPMQARAMPSCSTRPIAAARICRM
jgi:5-oxoprolinase (ATP-hydrolysing)